MALLRVAIGFERELLPLAEDALKETGRARDARGIEMQVGELLACCNCLHAKT